MFEVQINDIYIVSKDVGGISDIETSLNYNEELGVYSLSSPRTLTIVGTGFKNLYEAFINNFENKYSIEIYKTVDGLRYTLFSGEIFLSDCVFHPRYCKAEVPLINKGFQNAIEANTTVPVSMTAEQSRNSKTGDEIYITPPTPIALGEFYFWIAPASAGEHNGVDVWDLKDCFEHIVNYISDGTVTFSSTWYDNIGATNKVGVTTGEIFRTGGGDAPILNFRDLFLWCKKLWDLVFVFETNSDGTKNMRIEHVSFLETNGNFLSITNTVDLTVQIDQSKLFTSIRVGSNEAFNTNGEINGNFQFPKIQGGSFGIEEFAVQSESTTDQQLDLTVDVLYDHNKLEDMAINSNTDYDDKIVFIQYTETTNVPTTGDVLGVAPLSDAEYFYNQIFINSEILKRQSIYAPLVLHISDGSDTFFAINALITDSSADVYNYIDTTPVTGSYNLSSFDSPIRYLNDYGSVNFSDGSVLTGFDANNNYGNGTIQGTNVSGSNSKFIAPSDGVYAFEAKTKVSITYFKTNFALVRQRIVITDSVGTVKSTTEAEYVTRVVYNSVYGGYEIKWYANGNGYSDWQLVGWSSLYDIQSGLKFNILQNELLYLDTDDRVYIELECEERSTTSLYPLPEYDAEYTGTNWTEGSGTQFIIKPVYFACTKTTEALNIHINTEKPLGLYQLSFDSVLTEEQIKDILGASNTSVRINNETIISNGIVKNLSIKHKDNLCKFVVASRNIQNGS